jgi:hypothetical protein
MPMQAAMSLLPCCSIQAHAHRCAASGCDQHRVDELIRIIVATGSKEGILFDFTGVVTISGLDGQAGLPPVYQGLMGILTGLCISITSS